MLKTKIDSLYFNTDHGSQCTAAWNHQTGKCFQWLSQPLLISACIISIFKIINKIWELKFCVLTSVSRPTVRKSSDYMSITDTHFLHEQTYQTYDWMQVSLSIYPLSEMSLERKLNTGSHRSMSLNSFYTCPVSSQSSMHASMHQHWQVRSWIAQR